MLIVMRFDPNNRKRFFMEEDRQLAFNIAAFLEVPSDIVDQEVHRTIDYLLEYITDTEIRFNVSFQRLNDDFTSISNSLLIGEGAVRLIRQSAAAFVVRAKRHGCEEWLPTGYPPATLSAAAALLRYGNVELQAVENYLCDPTATKAAVHAIVDRLDEEGFMYAPGATSNYLAADDIEWTIRKLMTNAGLYVSRDKDLAWRDFSTWADAYIDAIMEGKMLAYPGAYPFAFEIQRRILQSHGKRLSYVDHPSAFEFYELIAGKRTLFMSPLSDLAVEQHRSGRLKALYRDYVVPDFELFAMDAPMSTWPNRPGEGWTESFKEMCFKLDAYYERYRFDIFVASCGCYGLPISHYATKTYGINSLYMGNLSHAFFGIRQNATKDYMLDMINTDMLAEGNLSRFKNHDLIDGGRYV